MNYILFIVIASCWSGSFIAIQPLVQAMPPLLAGALRIGVAVVFLTALLPMIKIPMSVPKGIRVRVWITGLTAFAVPFSLLFWGEKTISPGLAGILNGTVPIWVFIFGLVFAPKAEPITPRKVIGLIAGIAGIMAIFLPKIVVADSTQSSYDTLFGTIAVTLMACSYATGVLLNRTLFVKNPSLSPFTNLYQQLIAGFFGLSVVAISVDGLPHPETWHPISTVFFAETYLGVVSTSIAFMMFYRLIQQWGSVRAATVTYVVPAVTLIFDVIFNSRTPTLSDIGGVLGITFGVVILNLPGKKTT